MPLDFEAYGEQFEKDDNRGGGGGGGGNRDGKKKGERQSKDVLEKRKESWALAGEAKRAEEAEKHPEVNRDENVSFESTVRRLLDLDENETGLPRLEGYFVWLRKILEDDEYRNARSLGVESRIETYRKAHGAGGQNVNKVATAVRYEHLPTGIKLKRAEERTQEANRKRALEDAKVLVDRHIDEVMDVVTESSSPTLDVVRRLMDKVVGDPSQQEWWTEAKKSSLERIRSSVLKQK